MLNIKLIKLMRNIQGKHEINYLVFKLLIIIHGYILSPNTIIVAK